MTSPDEKLQKLYALFERTGSEGEKQAALEAIERLKSKRKEVEVKEWCRTFPDYGSSRLFRAVCDKYGVELFRYKGQKRTTLNYNVSQEMREILKTEFEELYDTWVRINSEILDDLVDRYEGKAREVTARLTHSKKGADL